MAFCAFSFNDQLSDMVVSDLKSGHVPMLLGEPGIGKTSWVKAMASMRHTRAYVLACNQLADKADLTGARPIKGDDGKYRMSFFPHITIMDAIAYAQANPTENPILFLDEINRTTPDVTSELLSIPTERAIGGEALPSNLWVMVAGNDKGNITTLDEASISRFVLYHVVPDQKTFLALDQNLNEYVREVLETHPEYIFQKPAAEDDENGGVNSVDDFLFDEGMNQFTTPRTITGVSDWLNEMGQDKLKNLASRTLQDNAGNTSTALEAALVAHVGATAFCADLNLAVTKGINKANIADMNQRKTPKPAVWEELIAQTSIDAIDDFAETLSERDISGCLVYALSSKRDNTHVINALVRQIERKMRNENRGADSILGDDLAMLAANATSSNVNDVNVRALQATGGVLWNTIRIIFAASGWLD